MPFGQKAIFFDIKQYFELNLNFVKTKKCPLSDNRNSFDDLILSNIDTLLILGDQICKSNHGFTKFFRVQKYDQSRLKVDCSID